MTKIASKTKHLSALGLVLCGALNIALPLEAKSPAPKQKSAFERILATYHFVGDFRQKEATRILKTDQLFWRYPLTLPKISFPLIELNMKSPQATLEHNLPPTLGEGLALEHLNRGRGAFLRGDYLEAKETWLSARARYGVNYDFHRRNDYFLARVFLALGFQDLSRSGDFKADGTKQLFENASTFYSWAFQVKKEFKDPFLDELAPESYYNLASIYFLFERFPPSFGAARDGLDFLRATGRTEYRPELRRILAESFIKNRSYLEAVQELDTALRQDPDPLRAYDILARVADIYFDLNNFELAEDIYGLALKIGQEVKKLNPKDLVLRGESLFWLGQFSEAQKLFSYALEIEGKTSAAAPLPPDYTAHASLRMADSYLAQGRIEEAKLAYFRHQSQFRTGALEPYAKIRLACLEIMTAEDKNILHYRNELAKLRLEALDPQAVELAHYCELNSYVMLEPSEETLNRVKAFAALYPKSKKLLSFKDSIQAYQSTKIEPLIAAKDHMATTRFFEQNRGRLYPKIEPKLAIALFRAYADTHRSIQAAEFWEPFAKQSASLEDLERLSLVASDHGIAKALWLKRNQWVATKMSRLAALKKPAEHTLIAWERISSGPAAKLHRPWLYHLSKDWPNDDISLMCEVTYPLLAALRAEPQGSFNVAKVGSEVERLLAVHLNELLKKDTECGYSLLEFEMNLGAHEALTLYHRYEKRDYLPFDTLITGLLWNLAELLNDQGHPQEAALIWTKIRDKAPENTKEKTLATSRLSSYKGEFEKLWSP